jgi:hypothetical protein
MSAAEAKLETPVEREPGITSTRGAAISMAAFRWEGEIQQHANQHLLMLLGAATGALEPSAGGSYSLRDDRDWPSLRDLPAGAVEEVISRLAAARPGWVLEGGDGETLLDRLDNHFMLAMARRAAM